MSQLTFVTWPPGPPRRAVTLDEANTLAALAVNVGVVVSAVSEWPPESAIG